MSGSVTLNINDGIAEITLDRPEKHNAITPEMASALAEHCARVDRDDAVRVVFVKGAGNRAFCTGSDIKSLAQFPSAWHFRNRVEYAMALRNVQKPVIAALKGWVLGGGGELALAADIRVAGTSTRCGFPEVTRGWVGGGGASQLLPRLIGYGQAMRMLLTGEIVDAAEAQRLGLFEIVVDDAEVESVARALCRQIASYSPIATQAVKASVRASLSTALEIGIRYENEMNVMCFAVGNHLEGIKAFSEDHSPDSRR